MDTVSESSMAVSMAASEASPSSTTTTPRPTSTPSSAPPSPAGLFQGRIGVKVGDCMEAAVAAGSSRYDFDQAASFLARNVVDWAPLVSGEDGEVVDVFSAEDVERIRGFSKARGRRHWGRWGFHGGRGDGDKVHLGLLKRASSNPEMREVGISASATSACVTRLAGLSDGLTLQCLSATKSIGRISEVELFLAMTINKGILLGFVASGLIGLVAGSVAVAASLGVCLSNLCTLNFFNCTNDGLKFSSRSSTSLDLANKEVAYEDGIPQFDREENKLFVYHVKVMQNAQFKTMA
ncbi:hypothetical protein Syun_004476 [Stephania yunnanensis]|uniref:Uncharacterized protein n=1 Tax=Stephania yunnanensis TaxID=152371 RepID=A0AAP0L795_9MAGN